MFMVLSQIRKTPCNVATHCTQVVLNSFFLSKNVSHFSPQARLFLTVPTSMLCMYVYTLGFLVSYVLIDHVTVALI